MPYNSHVSESVEYLVKRPGFDMDQTILPREDSSTCLGIFDCLSAKEAVRENKESYAQKRASRRIGVERQMGVVHNQPHLVEPMKLTVYDDLPSTPMFIAQQSHVSKFVHEGRKSISRASTRASIAVRKRANSKLSISKPQAIIPVDGCHLRRHPSFRPLQLSIYMSEKRLSDLPEFDTLSFNEEGEIRAPPRALIRTQSEELLTSHLSTPLQDLPGKPASMFEQSLSRRISHARKNTDSTLISSSRPASEYEALNSHPVSWFSVPGLPPTMQFATAPSLVRKILSPMQEEFTPSPTGAVIIDGKVLAFPDVDAYRLGTEMAHSSLLPPVQGQEGSSEAPSPTIGFGPNRITTLITKHKTKISESASILLASSANSTRTRANTSDPPEVPATTQPFDDPRSYFHTDFKTNNRINQWLDSDSKGVQNRSRQSSVSTDRSTTTTLSFAEHRRKRSQFYQLNHSKTAIEDAENKSDKSASNVLKTPTPLNLYKPFPPQKALNANNDSQSKSSVCLKSHARSQTTSTVASTIATDVLFEHPETPELEFEERDSAHALPCQLNKRAYDAESVTTVDMKSRTGTMKSNAPSQRRETPSPAPTTTAPYPVSYSEQESNPGVEIVSITKSADMGFVFRGNTPSPCPPTSSPQTPLSAKTHDIEKMMFDMCAQSGYRRINVGVAF